MSSFFRKLAWVLVLCAIFAASVVRAANTITLLAPGLAPGAFALTDDSVTKLSTGPSRERVLGLRMDGRACGWTWSGAPLTSPFLDSLTAVREIVDTNGAIIALLQDGSIRATGGLRSSASSHGDVPVNPLPSFPKFSDIMTGWGALIALTETGEIVTWGWLPEEVKTLLSTEKSVRRLVKEGGAVLGQRNDGTLIYVPTAGGLAAAAPSGATLADAVGFAGTGQMTVAMLVDGSVVGWGAGAQDLVQLIGERPVSRILFNNEKPIIFTTAGELLGDGLPAASELVTSPVLDAVLGYNGGLLILHDLKTGVIRGQSAGVEALLPGQVAGVWADVIGSHLSFQWFLDGEAVEGAVAPGLALGLIEAANTGSYRLRVSNPVGEVWSEPIVVRKLDGQAPQRRVILNPGDALELTATIPDAVSYRWFFNGREIDGEAAASFSQADVGMEDTGVYTLEASLGDGAVTRTTSFVRVVPRHRGLATWSYIEGYDLVRRERSVLTNAVDFTLAQNFGGSSLLVVVLPDGSVSGFYWNEETPVFSPMAGFRNVVELAGAGSLLALSSDGGVGAPIGQSGAPAGLSRVVGLVAGNSQEYFALLDDGSVVAWGAVRDELDLLTNPGERVLQLTANFGVLADGSVKFWRPTTNAVEFALRALTNVRRVVEISAGYMVEHADGSVVRLGAAEALPGFEGMPRSIHDFAGDYVVETTDGSLSGAGTWWTDGVSMVVKAETAPRRFVVMQEIATPEIATPRTSELALTGQRLVLSASPEGDFLSYRWEKGGVPVADANEAHLVLDPVTTSMAGDYVLIASNDGGEARSEAITVEVLSGTPPPRRSVVEEGKAFTLRVSAPGGASVRWLKNGAPIVGATSPALIFAKTRATDAGSYVAEVTLEGKALRLPSFLAISNPAWELARFGGANGSRVVGTDVPSGSVVSVNSLPITRDGNVLSFDMGGPDYGGIVQIDGLWGNLVTADGEARWASPFHLARKIPVAALSGVIAVAKGFALKADGTRVQLDPGNLEPANPSMADFFPEVRPSGLSSAPLVAVPVEIYSANFVQLRDDGTLGLSWEAGAWWGDFGRMRNVVSLAPGYVLYRSQAPKILRHPASQTAPSDGAVLSVEVSEHPVTYQWYKNGRAIAAPDGTAAEYWVANSPEMAGKYHVKVTNNRGSATSRAARVVVELPNPFPATLVTRFGYFAEFVTYFHGATDAGPRVFIRGLPPGLTLDPATGLIVGTLTKPGVYHITYGYKGGESGPSWSTTVRFVVSTWAHGPFEALLRTGEFDDGEVVGKITLQVGTDASFTGSLTSVDRTAALPFRGTLTGIGDEIEIPLRDGRLLRVFLHNDDEGFIQLREWGKPASGGALRPVKKYAGNATEHAPWASSRSVRYTAALIDPQAREETDERAFPPGSGRFEVVADANGELRIRGRLADGKAATAKLRPDGDGAFRWLTKPYGNRGHVGAEIRMVQRLGGRFAIHKDGVSWSRGAASGDRAAAYPDGFAVSARLIATPWDKPEAASQSGDLSALLGLAPGDQVRIQLLATTPEVAMFELPLMNFDATTGTLWPSALEEQASDLVLRIDHSSGLLRGAIPFRYREQDDADRRKWTVDGIALQANGHDAGALAEGYLFPPSGSSSREEGTGRIRIIVNDGEE